MARAIVASARAYGDDPQQALTSSFLGHRRSLAAAAAAQIELMGPLDPTRRAAVAAIFRCGWKTVYAAQARGGSAFENARLAARRALQPSGGGEG